MFYQVIRIFFKDENKSNPVKYFNNYLSAQTHYHNIISVGLQNNNSDNMFKYAVFNCKRIESE